MRIVFACVVLCVSSTAYADLQVRWDCYLPRGSVDCIDLGNAYFESVPGLERMDDAPVVVEVRATPLANAHRYAVVVSDDESRIKVASQVQNSRGRDQARMDVLALLHRGTMPLLRVTAPGTTDEGTFHLEAEVDDDAEADPTTGWYVRPRLGGNMFRGGITIVSLSGGLVLNHSGKRHRALLDVGASYRYVDFDLPDDQTLTGGFVTANGRAVLARSLGRGFSAALLGSSKREPQNNLDVRGEIGAGLEWLREPILENEATNVGLRYRLLAVRDRYVTENRDGDRELWYSRHSLALFGQLHSDKTDLALDLGVGAPLLAPRSWDVWGGASVTMRAAKGLEITLGGNLLVRNRALNEPADVDALDPVTSVAGRNFGRLSYGARLSLAYTFGNGLLHGQDQRWN